MPFPVEPLQQLDLTNDIPGFKKNVRLHFGKDQVRYLDWTPGDKPAGTVRALAWAAGRRWGFSRGRRTPGGASSTGNLTKSGLKVEMAARGYERAGIIEMAASSAGIIERLKPDVIVLNTGFDDVIVHSAAYTYKADKLAKMPQPKPASATEFLVKYSQSARFKRWWSKDSEAKQMQNLHGRKDKYKKYFDEKREMILSLPQSEGIPRTAGTNDPLPEYLDGIKAFKAMADKAGATLVLTGEASLHDSVINLTQELSRSPTSRSASLRPREMSARRVPARHGS